MNFLRKASFHILFIVFLTILIFTTYKHYGISWDENRFISTGKYYLINLFSLLGLKTNLINDTSQYYFFDNVLHAQTHGVIFDMLTVLTTLPFGKISFETFHLIRSLLAIPTFLFLSYIVSKLVGRNYGLLAMIFLLLFPRFYGNIYISPIDIPTALFFSATVAYFLYFLQKRHHRLNQIILGFLMGMMINQRLILSYVFALNITMLVMLELIEKKRTWRQILSDLLILAIATLATMHLTNPQLLKNPLVGLYKTIALSVKFLPFNANVLFDGQSIHSSQLPWYYLPKYMLITIPLVTVSLFLLGTVKLIFNIVKSGISKNSKLQSGYALLLFYFPLTTVLLLRPVLYDSWRLFFFLTIPIIIIAMYGLKALGERASPVQFKIVLLIFIGFNLLITAREMITLHPYQYVYFNSLVGGLKGADGKYETDYWALGNKEAVEWFNKNVNKKDQNYVLMTEGDAFSASYYFKKNMTQTFDFSKADYYIAFTRWSRNNAYPGNVIHVVERKGVPLIYIKKPPQ